MRILGIDVGARSVGWALLEGPGEEPQKLIALGTRIFEAGVEGDIEKGRDGSRAVARRQARLSRRQTARRARRQRKLYRHLARAGLLPDLADLSAETRDRTLKELDRTLQTLPVFADATPTQRHHLFPYYLRTIALEREVPAFAVGRALYHLAQRRGFLSNRRRDRTADIKEEETVLKGIATLQEALAASGAQTLGAYFATLDPVLERVRSRYTHREMYGKEFDAIWTAQAQYHAAMTAEARRKVESAIFLQRPLRSAKHLIGRCSLEPKRHRCPWADPLAQEFRLLQQVNDLRLVGPLGEVETLTPSQRKTLVDHLTTAHTLTLPQARKLIGAPKGWKFTREIENGDKLRGNATLAALNKALGDRFAALSEEELGTALQILRREEHDERRTKRAQVELGLGADAAEAFSRISLEDGHCAYSRSTLLRLLPHLRDGTALATAKKAEYGTVEVRPPLDKLPPVKDAIPELRNPAVIRSLTELRKVVNALVREYGPVDRIRLELARDLKRNRKQRMADWARNNERARRRDRTKDLLASHYGIMNASREDVEKHLLYEECGGVCPYTGKAISPSQLFGPNPAVDVEHVLPYPRSLDDSFLNKTLCFAEENRKRKGNRTPYEAYGQDKDLYADILQRVAKFKGDAAAAKMERFRATELTEEFATRSLNDTRYISTLARDYLALLFGRNSDGSSITGRVDITTGGLTAIVRNVVGLSGLLNEGGPKTRDDHRHHALDAVVVALTTPSIVRQLQRAAKTSHRQGRIPTGAVDAGWDGMAEEIGEAVHQMIVSVRPEHTLRGALHDETVYAVRQQPDGRTAVSVRKTDELGTLRKTVSYNVTKIGKGASGRHVRPNSNYRLLVWEVAKPDGTKQIAYTVESRLELWQRKAAQRDEKHLPPPVPPTPAHRLLAVIHQTDVMTLTTGTGDAKASRLVRVTGISAGEIEAAELNDARLKKERARVRISPSQYLTQKATLVAVDALGRVR
jgi:CRISPR-associated endonuclease Csn1